MSQLLLKDALSKKSNLIITNHPAITAYINKEFERFPLFENYYYINASSREFLTTRKEGTIPPLLTIATIIDYHGLLGVERHNELKTLIAPYDTAYGILKLNGSSGDTLTLRLLRHQNKPYASNGITYNKLTDTKIKEIMTQFGTILYNTLGQKEETLF